MRIGLIGKKIGMTREFLDSGLSLPVTVIEVEKGRILNVITKERRGYDAIQVGFGKIKASKIKKQMKGFFAKKSIEPKKFLKEFRVDNISEFKEGNEIGLELFKDQKFVDIQSKTIGKGFAGVMKRHNFSGLRASHGVSVSHRAHGSTGQNQDPGKVFKGKKMAGHMGNKIRTIQNLEIIKSDLENNLIFIKGSVPGSKNSIVLIQKNVKKINRITTLEKYKKIQEQISGVKAKSKNKSKTPEKKEAIAKKTASKPESKEVKNK
jgi:large subunit ribosomal protein L3